MPSGNLWTGRVYDFRKIREYYSSATLICVMRWPPKYISLQKEGIEHIPSLSPTVENFQRYKKEQNWEKFMRKFVSDFKKNEEAQKDLDDIEERLRLGENIVFLCHEKANENCHRKLLAYLLRDDDYYKGEVSLETDRLDWW